MESLVHGMLSNAVAAAMLALAVGVLSRLCRRPALIHSLWLVVLLKLVTPPVVPVSLPLPLLAYTHKLTTGREPSIFRLGHLLAATGEQQAGDQLDDLQVGFEAKGSLPDDRLPSTEYAPMEVIGDPPAEEQPPSELTSRGQLPPLGASRQAARTLPTAAWGSRLVMMRARLSWEAWVLIVVLSGALGWWSLAAVRIIRFHRVVKDAPSVPREWQEQTDELAEHLGLSRRPEARLVPGQVPPMLWAIGGRPRLLVPIQLWSTLEPDQQTSLLLHELAHLRRRDHWVRWLELIVGGLYWWHPAVWWTRRALREAEEQCCDAWVVWAMPRGAKTYAAALLAALEFVSGARTAPAAASATSGNGHVSCLKRRLRMIVRASTPKGLSWIGRLAVMGMAALILPLAPSWARDNQTKPDPTRSEQLAGVEDTTPHPNVNAKSESRAHEPLLARLATDDDEDDKKDDKSRDAAKRLEDQARDLIEKLSKEFGPVGEELRKALERAVGEVHKSLEKDNPSPDDLREALEKSQEEVRRALEQGGPVDNELREAWERSRKELREAWEHARDDIRQVMRDRVEVARQRQREQAEQAEQARERPERVRPEAEGGPPGEAEARQHRQEVETARREIRELEQQLRRATRRLEELDRREARRAQRRPAGRPRAEAEPPRPPEAPSAPTAPRAEPAPAAPAPPARPGQRDVRRPRFAPGEPGVERPGPNPRPSERPLPRGRSGEPGFERPGPNPRPDYERRFRDLEDKLNQLLKELKDMKGEQKPKTSAEPNAKVVTTATPGVTIAA